MLNSVIKRVSPGRVSFGAACLAGAVGLAAGLRASAAPFDPKVVGKGAAWVVHVDAEAVVASAVGKHALANKDLFDIDEELEVFGIDPEKDLFSITVYGADPGEDEDADVTTVVVGSENVEAQAKKLAEKHGELKTEIVEGMTIYTVDPDEDEPMSVIVAPGPGANRRYLIAAPTKEHVLWALKVVQGKAERIGGEGLSPKPGSMVFGAATNMLQDLDIEPAANMLKMAEGGTIDIGEVGADIYADLTVSTATEQDAKDMTQVVSGLLAMGRMMVGDEPDMKPLLDAAAGIMPEAQGKSMRVQWKYPSAKVIEAMEKAVKHHHGEHDAHDGDHKGDEGHKRGRKTL